jgi:hypothetical protein
MATSSKRAVDLLRELLNKSSLDVVTLRWDEFYTAIERERLSEGFLNDLAQKGKDAGLHVSFGNATVLVAKDYNFSPVKGV